MKLLLHPLKPALLIRPELPYRLKLCLFSFTQEAYLTRFELFLCICVGGLMTTCSSSKRGPLHRQLWQQV